MTVAGDRDGAGRSGSAVAHTAIRAVRARVYVVPTTFDGQPMNESDGTAKWDSTTVLVVEIDAGGCTGLGYAYTSSTGLGLVRDVLAPLVTGADAMATPQLFWGMARAVRNVGWRGIAASAISAMDVALHDLKAKLLDVSLLRLLGASRDRIMVYGSGGFTSYTDEQLREQLGGWAEQGIRAVKMKIGTDAAADPSRVRTAREAVGDDVQLFVDANGAYSRKQALGMAELFWREDRVTWFEEPVSSDDLEGLRLMRDRGPGGMQIAAGEYGYMPADFRLLLTAGVAVLVVSALSILGSSTQVFSHDVDTTIRWAIQVATVLLNGTVLTILFRLGAAREHRIRYAAPGGFAVAMMWLLLQYVGTLYVTNVLTKTGPVNQTFGLVLGMMGLIWFAAVMGVLGMEVNVVLARRLWPRALLTPFTDQVDLTEADRRAYASYALMARHKGFETVAVTFDGRDGDTHEIVMDPSWARKRSRAKRAREATEPDHF